MISGKKFTFSFKTFPRPPPLALVLSMVKIRPETPRFRCCTFKKEKGVKMVSRVEKQMTSIVHSDYFLYCKFRFDSSNILDIKCVCLFGQTKSNFWGCSFFSFWPRSLFFRMKLNQVWLDLEYQPFLTSHQTVPECSVSAWSCRHPPSASVLQHGFPSLFQGHLPHVACRQIADGQSGATKLNDYYNYSMCSDKQNVHWTPPPTKLERKCYQAQFNIPTRLY